MNKVQWITAGAAVAIALTWAAWTAYETAASTLLKVPDCEESVELETTPMLDMPKAAKKAANRTARKATKKKTANRTARKATKKAATTKADAHEKRLHTLAMSMSAVAHEVGDIRGEVIERTAVLERKLDELLSR